MANNKPNYINYTLLVGCLLLATGITHSRAVLMLGEAFIFISALLRVKEWNKSTFKNNYWIILGYIVLIGAISYLNVSHTDTWLRVFKMKLPLLLLPIGLFYVNRLPFKWLVYILITYAGTISVIAIASTIDYFQHYEEMNQLVLQSRPIEIVSKISHIYFSIFSSFSIIAMGYLYINFSRYKLNAQLKNIILGIGLINLICLHILSARTGLLGFYFSLFTLGVLLVIKFKKLKLALIGAGIAVVILSAAYMFMGSFKNRIDNTITDIKITYNNENPNYRSFAMRFEAWKTAVHIIKDNYQFGVGLGDVEDAMQTQYIVDDTLLVPENRIPPHNQFLNEGVAFGVIGILLLLILFILPFAGDKLITHPMFLGFWGILLMGCLFESVLERQRGIAFVAFFLFFIQGFIKAEQEQAK